MHERIRLAIFGLSVSSSWGNGHATLWRGLISALVRRGHQVAFFERDVPYYADHRDLPKLEGAELILYRSWEEVLPLARRHLAEADVAMVTSYCPDATPASDLVLESNAAVRAFYDLDSGVSLERARGGHRVEYIPDRGLGDFDVVLSYTGGAALEGLKDVFGARRVVPLYGSVDPEAHFPTPPRPGRKAGLSYLGTYSADRQRMLQELFIDPARRLPERDFVIGGSMYPQGFPWLPNIRFLQHVPPPEHPAFYCSSRLTLNVTRAPMAAMGFCPSARLFEAAACGVPVLSDHWQGIEAFFEIGEELLVARTADEAVAAIELSDAELLRVARAARERTLADHTADRRAGELLELLDQAARRRGEHTAVAAEGGA